MSKGDRKLDNKLASIKNEKEEMETRPKLKIDWRVYEEYLADADIPEDQKKELIEALWGIIVSFVDLGFGIESAQAAIDVRSAKKVTA
ncbi:MAG: hypothetical protein H6876_06245 [Hyphomicrobiaceae bacterium]|nr:hypothetical protein [Hyphomicrobiaceae bacterium]